MSHPRILLIGKSGRLDCILDTFHQSAEPKELYVYAEMSNPSLQAKSQGLRLGMTKDLAAMTTYAQEVKPDITIIDPEEPLGLGVVDSLTRLGFPCVGPTQSLARLETSKLFTRQILDRHGIEGNPLYQVFYALKGMEDCLKELEKSGGGYVIKPDGLTGGKGVMVSGDHLTSISHALGYAQEIISRDGFVLVEEKLEGEEFSLQCFTDGKTVRDMIPVQDHKRAWEGDHGPNTGGMGSYSCADQLLPFLDLKDIRQATAINAAVLDALQSETGERYQGVLYGGFMATKGGVKLIEYNVRFGDPEVMNVLPRLTTDFLRICDGIVTGNLHNVPVTFDNRASVCKYVVPDGYGTFPVKNYYLTNIPTPTENLRVYYGSLQEDLHGVYLLGSRAVALVGLAATMGEAERIAEEAAQQIQGPVFHRKDIGTPSLIWKRIEHLRGLRRPV